MAFTWKSVVTAVRQFAKHDAFAKSPDSLSFSELAIAYAGLDRQAKEIEKRKKLVREHLLEHTKAFGAQDETGHCTLQVEDTVTVTAQRKESSVPDEQQVKNLMESAGVPLNEVFDTIKTVVLNPSKLQSAVDRGLLDERKVQKLHNVSFALIVRPSGDFADAQDEVYASDEPSPKTAKKSARR